MLKLISLELSPGYRVFCRIS